MGNKCAYLRGTTLSAILLALIHSRSEKLQPEKQAVVLSQELKEAKLPPLMSCDLLIAKLKSLPSTWNLVLDSSHAKVLRDLRPSAHECKQMGLYLDTKRNLLEQFLRMMVKRGTFGGSDLEFFRVIGLIPENLEMVLNGLIQVAEMLPNAPKDQQLLDLLTFLNRIDSSFPKNWHDFVYKAISLALKQYSQFHSENESKRIIFFLNHLDAKQKGSLCHEISWVELSNGKSSSDFTLLRVLFNSFEECISQSSKGIDEFIEALRRAMISNPTDQHWKEAITILQKITKDHISKDNLAMLELLRYQDANVEARRNLARNDTLFTSFDKNVDVDFDNLLSWTCFPKMTFTALVNLSNEDRCAVLVKNLDLFLNDRTCENVINAMKQMEFLVGHTECKELSLKWKIRWENLVFTLIKSKRIMELSAVMSAIPKNIDSKTIERLCKALRAVPQEIIIGEVVARLKCKNKD
jgi:hypothetical protein